MNFEVQALADVLFGSKDSGEPDYSKAHVMVREFMRLLSKVLREGSVPDKLMRWRAEFCSRYLHRSICFLLPRLPHVDWTTLELQLASVLLQSVYFCRWIRTAPTAKVELLFVRMVESWVKTCPDLASLFEAEVREGKFVGSRAEQFNSCLCYSQQLSFIITHFPSTFVDLRLSTAFASPSILPSLVRDLGVLAKRSQTLLRSTTTSPALRSNINLLLTSTDAGLSVVLSYLLNPTKSALEAREELLCASIERGPTVVWFQCGAGTMNGPVPCGEKGEGELMACGRCQTVRYCCRDHQRLHWKKHKNLCFAVEWGPMDL